MERTGLQDILTINLTTGAIERTPVSRPMALDFIGGQGIGSYLLVKHVKPGTDPLGPDNALILAPGQLAGTPVPSASRSAFLAKSPTIGCYLGMSNGGSLTQLRQAGYDVLVLLGRAPHPVYIKITDGDVQVRDARHLWGKDTFETAEALWSELGQHYDVAAIGPAGENLVRHAAIIGNRHVAWGRTGMGAIMGAKRLKAIAVSGSAGAPAARPAKLLKLSKATALDIVGDAESIHVWRDGGTWKWAHLNPKPMRNAQSDLWDYNKYDEKFEHRPVACPGCPVGCKHALKVKPGYKDEGLELTVGCTFATMNGPFGLGLGLTLMEDMMRCGEGVQRLGMDSEVTAGIISLLIELYEAGIVTGQETGGLELRWGDGELAMELMRRVAHRDGIGHWLAEGTAHMVRTLGGGSERHLTDFKGMARALTAHGGGDIRKAFTTQSLAWAVNFRGHGDRHRYPFHGGTVDQKQSNVDALLDRADHFGIPGEVLAQSSRRPEEAVPRLMRYVQDYNTVAYALGFCDRPVILNALSIDRMTELYNHATGLDVSSHHLLAAGRRIWNMEKAWVTMQGQSRADDYPPERFFSETIRYYKPGEGEVVYPPFQRDVYERVLTTYYQSQGWDPTTGLPTVEGLRSAGLGWITDDYAAHLGHRRTAP